jgi:hypothetical protein
MYDMYPDWGPAKHRSSDTVTASSGHRAGAWDTDTRDDGVERPDDN